VSAGPCPLPIQRLKNTVQRLPGNMMGCRQYADSDLHLRNKTELESLPTRRRQQPRLPDNFVALIAHGIILDMSYHRVFLYELILIENLRKAELRQKNFRTLFQYQFSVCLFLCLTLFLATARVLRCRMWKSSRRQSICLSLPDRHAMSRNEACIMNYE